MGPKKMYRSQAVWQARLFTPPHTWLMTPPHSAERIQSLEPEAVMTVPASRVLAFIAYANSLDLSTAPPQLLHVIGLGGADELGAGAFAIGDLNGDGTAR